MPNSFMHHVTINGTNFEIEDKQARDDLNDLKSDLDDIEDIVEVQTVTKEALTPVSDVTTGYVYNFNSLSPTESSSRAYGKYAVNGKKTLKITGGSAAIVPNFALCGAFDSSNNLLGTFGTTASTDYTEFEITTPNDTAYIIVNGTYGVASGERVLVIGAKEVIVTKSSAIVQKEYAYKAVGEIVFGAYMNNTTLAEVSSFGCSYIDYTLAENETATKAKVSGKNGNSNKNFYTATFYDSENNALLKYGEQNTGYSGVEINLPEGTKRIVINGCYYNSGLITSFQPTAKLELYEAVDVYEIAKNAVPNQWRGKKITILGTSVAYGAYSRTNYINEASKILGFSVFNTGVPGGSITVTESDGAIYPVGNTGYSSVMSIAEYAAAGITVPSDPSDSHYYCSWERIFTSEANDTDLFIFACIPNNTNFDLTDWNDFDKESWSYSSGTFADHRQTFLGGLLFLIDKMYAYKSDARMALLIDTSIGLSASSKTAINTIAEYYNIPLIDLWNQIQTTPQMLSLLKSENGTNNHPSTYAHQLMGKILAGKLLSVY